MKKLLLKFTSTFLILFSILFALNRNLIEKGFLKFFYSGTQHFSFFIRWKGIIYFWNAFLDNLFIGVGLGGASTYMMKSLFGETVDPLDPLILDMVPATNVTMETLASLGLLGGIAFVYLFCTIIKSFKDALKIEYITEEEKLNLISFAISLCVVIFTLQFNQSIMRPYIWLHTGICVGYANYIKDKYTNFIGVPSL
ncbi:MAG TPA: hypothetical protein VLE89_05270 [Chlamydiales bacterium]|nr:hypothetical protein [Chlamydiales bacterium]